MGPFLHPSINKEKYVLSFIDNYTRNTLVYVLGIKNETFEHIQDFKSHAEKKLGNMNKILCTGNGGGT